MKRQFVCLIMVLLTMYVSISASSDTTPHSDKYIKAEYFTHQVLEHGEHFDLGDNCFVRSLEIEPTRNPGLHMVIAGEEKTDTEHVYTQGHMLLCATIRNKRKSKKYAGKHACLIGTTFQEESCNLPLDHLHNLLNKTARFLKKLQFHPSFIGEEQAVFDNALVTAGFTRFESSHRIYKFFEAHHRTLSQEYKPTTDSV